MVPPSTSPPSVTHTIARHPLNSYALATDAEGLRVLMERSAAFKCHADRLDAIRTAEVGASAAMLAAGYGLDSLQLKWGPLGQRRPAGGERRQGLAMPPKPSRPSALAHRALCKRLLAH